MSAPLSSAQFSLQDVDHGPEVEHGLRELGVDPSQASFVRSVAVLSKYGPTHVGDIEDDEDYERTSDMLGERDLPPIIVAKHREHGDVLLDGYARMNAAYTEGRRVLPAYRLRSAR